MPDNHTAMAIRIQGAGPSIGTYRGRDIHDWIDKDGQRFSYNRIAFEDGDGTIALDQLRPDEFVVSPGLIYRHAKDGGDAPG
jgi:hypothetical protein